MDSITLDWFWFWFGLLVIAVVAARALAAPSLGILSVLISLGHHTAKIVSEIRYIFNRKVPQKGLPG